MGEGALKLFLRGALIPHQSDSGMSVLSIPAAE
jgi:hypothetical protein